MSLSPPYIALQQSKQSAPNTSQLGPTPSSHGPKGANPRLLRKIGGRQGRQRTAAPALEWRAFGTRHAARATRQNRLVLGVDDSLLNGKRDWIGQNFDWEASRLFPWRSASDRPDFSFMFLQDDLPRIFLFYVNSGRGGGGKMETLVLAVYAESVGVCFGEREAVGARVWGFSDELRKQLLRPTLWPSAPSRLPFAPLPVVPRFKSTALQSALSSEEGSTLWEARESGGVQIGLDLRSTERSRSGRARAGSSRHSRHHLLPAASQPFRRTMQGRKQEVFEKASCLLPQAAGDGEEKEVEKQMRSPVLSRKLSLFQSVEDSNPPQSSIWRNPLSSGGAVRNVTASQSGTSPDTVKQATACDEGTWR
ncbi:hypothetical protein BDK51DRAFT_29521 [Blyttiomyces helicus]|uniref:Uncharacterized protein n=1 Tax=Blyttiomyces helicus TaxID=388810 RepID=A0A4P9WM05_9FUNG|nr:hypothetical protein BDK51DRAFT_29521 [Blyttiomyces helicus]|eukprot:RKO93934.1 hypothetical protein BDK51DRAFT_29521 [Blyttiomyces helicus]